jgi:hypothetical protein
MVLFFEEMSVLLEISNISQGIFFDRRPILFVEESYETIRARGFRRT